MHVNDIFRQTGGVDYGQVLRDVLVSGLSKVPRSLVSKLLAADVRFECSASFLRTMRAFQNLEPWALRLMDATGKYPTGAFESSRVDMGAFDQCLETAVRDRNGNVLSRGQWPTNYFEEFARRLEMTDDKMGRKLQRPSPPAHPAQTLKLEQLLKVAVTAHVAPTVQPQRSNHTWTLTPKRVSAWASSCLGIHSGERVEAMSFAATVF
ncbi:hypothetical protein HPB50_020039 [Hyalomma asiaticum]|uniref:Uncharacterized protein n=1 Tax=Hyalomma asiaticum TaxID=266040 RepID=A0ACB7SJF7_HYAAI|nr:hypothetical protein HPB50_020039 [Hyalomma asiaticum]